MYNSLTAVVFILLWEFGYGIRCYYCIGHKSVCDDTKYHTFSTKACNSGINFCFRAKENDILHFGCGEKNLTPNCPGDSSGSMCICKGDKCNDDKIEEKQVDKVEVEEVEEGSGTGEEEGSGTGEEEGETEKESEKKPSGSGRTVHYGISIFICVVLAFRLLD